MDSSELAIEIAKALRDEGLAIDFADEDPDRFAVPDPSGGNLLVVTVEAFRHELHARDFPYPKKGTR